MKKAAIIMLSLLLVLPYLPSNAIEKDGKIILTIYGFNGVHRVEKKISIDNAIKMVENLKIVRQEK